MKTRQFFLIYLAGVVSFIRSLSAQPVQVAAGQVIRHAQFPSQYVAPRHVDVWLPPGYQNTQKYPVLYMHDGQMLFDSTNNWNKKEWQVDERIAKLGEEGRIEAPIVVAVWNTAAERHSDYFPQKPFDSLPKVGRDSILAARRVGGNEVFRTKHIISDQYLRFLVQELKPFIDSAYATKPDRQHTFLAGSSMGGLISLYALCEYPEVFGGAACLSTHWPGIFTMKGNPFPDAMVKYLQRKLPSPASHKLYFDYGTVGLDSLYPPLQQRVDVVLKKKGYTAQNWQSHAFPGKDHSEKAWSDRLEVPLSFLLGKQRQKPPRK